MSAHDRPANIPRRWDLVEGSYDGTPEDVLGRWYIVDAEDVVIDKRGRGYVTRREAWLAILDDPKRFGLSGCPACGSGRLLAGARDCGRCGWHGARRGPTYGEAW